MSRSNDFCSTDMVLHDSHLPSEFNIEMYIGAQGFRTGQRYNCNYNIGRIAILQVKTFPLLVTIDILYGVSVGWVYATQPLCVLY